MNHGRVRRGLLALTVVLSALGGTSAAAMAAPSSSTASKAAASAAQASPSLTALKKAATAVGEAGSFVSLSPSRLLDTRANVGANGPVAALGTVHLPVLGKGGVPATGVAAVVLNVTVNAPKSPGNITVYPDATTMPLASNLNFVPGQTIPNLVVAKVGANGNIALTNNSPGTVQLIADVAGYYLSGTPTAPGTYVPLNPARVLDTRTNLGATGPVAASGTVHLPVLGKGGVPATGVAAVVLNVTVNAPAQPGNITVYPDATTMPLASNLNFVPGQTIPNLVVAKIGANGNIALTNNSPGTVQLIADVAGYYLSGTPTAPGTYVPLNPARVLDTRTNLGATGPVAALNTVHLPVVGMGGVPATGVAAVVLNVTVNAPAQPGNITVYPDATTMPLASNLNFVPGQTIPNLVVAKIGANGNIALTNNSPGTVQLIADVAGYYLDAPLSASAVASGEDHTCALTTGGAVQCWGSNSNGQLGNGTTTDSTAPVQVSGLTTGVQAIAAGGDTSCAVTTAGAVKCWGYNGDGQLGNGSTVDSNVPVQVSGLTSGVKAIASGGGLGGFGHTCALTTGGGVQCWGSNSNGQLGNGTTTDSTTPVPVSDLTSGIKAISAGGFNACALTTTGAVQCWGFGGDGELGNGDTVDSSTPVQVTGLTSGVQALGTGTYHSCAVTAGGGVQCWGYNPSGELGNGTTTDSTTPVPVTGLTSGVADVTAAEDHSCALTTGGGVQCWGYNADGELGNGANSDSSTPVQVTGLTSGIQAVSAGGYHTCSIATGGHVQCWGYNGFGELGNGTTTNSNVPVGVSGF